MPDFSSFLIGDQTYQVRAVPELVGKNGAPLMGTTDYDGAELTYVDNATWKNSLFHEVMHAINNFIFVDHGGLSEKQVSRMTGAIRMFFIQNPQAISLLQEGEHGKEHTGT